TRFFSATVSPGLLLEGTNILAVEIHQANRTSSDISFDLDLVAQVVSGPPTITTQPQNQLSAIGGTAAFSVKAVGSPPLFYQWQFNGEDIPGATSATLRLTGVSAKDEGAYWVIVSNRFDMVVSDKANLTLINLTGDFFQITSLSSNNAQTVEHLNLT